MKIPQLISYLTVKAECFYPKIKNKIRVRMSALTTSKTVLGSSSQVDQERERKKNASRLERKSKTICICRWHNFLYRKFWGIHQKLL